LLLLCSATSNATYVILSHSLTRTSSSMKNIEEALLNEGFYLVNKGYPSRKHTIELLTGLAIGPALG
ncbi:MAG: hypothetical protein P8Q37_06885, partial [Porticoccaceae bacterium]|nr:hypothetical protein [Porticoccaceae bacterium]